jgi:uncharacterized protein YdeI (YjbR/CyaY-like superfamily)
MKMLRTLYVSTRDDWRAWLVEHHASATEVWLIYPKKSSSRPRIPYADAVEEAICFGWIDSLVQRIDDECFAQKFTPRKDATKWSAINKTRLRRMIKTGRMTPAGMAVIGDALKRVRPVEESEPRPADLPDEIEARLQQHPRAWAFFQSLAPSYRRHYVGWITAAKREDTRERRIHESIQKLEQHEKLGMK